MVEWSADIDGESFEEASSDMKDKIKAWILKQFPDRQVNGI